MSAIDDEIPAVDVRVRNAGDEQTRIQRQREAWRRDLATYRIECTNQQVDTTGQQGALVRQCEERRVGLEGRNQTIRSDESRIPQLSQEVLDATNQRQRLVSEQSRLRERIQTNKSRAISLAVASASLRARTGAACRAMPDVNAQACCLSVVNDGLSPSRCGVDPMFQAFERAGIFGGTVVRPRSTP